MRESVSQSKGRGTGLCKVRPDPNCRAGRLFDWFISNPGIVLNTAEIRKAVGYKNMANSNTTFVNEIDRLNDFYELDIRRIKNNRWCLVGRWDGSKYTDYVAQRHK